MSKYHVGQEVFFIDDEETCVCEGVIDTIQVDSQGLTYTLEDLPYRFAESDLYKTKKEAKEVL